MGPAQGTSLHFAGRPIRTLFDLLGTSEDGLTRGIAWVMLNSRGFLRAMMRDVMAFPVECDQVRIDFHRHELERGVTDLEVELFDYGTAIIEAKRGWILPDKTQLARYCGRASFKKADRPRAIASLSECSDDFARARLPGDVDGVPVRHLSWAGLRHHALASVSDASHAEKRLLREFAAHLEDRMSESRRGQSNRVYVVALGRDTVFGSAMTWIDVVEKHRRYFHPIGHGYPREPVSYIAFRYDGRLQSIHHVDDYFVADVLADAAPGLPNSRLDGLHFVYKLGPPILPKPDMRAGPRVRQSARVWCELDLLLTEDSLSDALTATQKRDAARGR